MILQVVFDTTKEAILAGSGQTYYQSIPWQTVSNTWPSREANYQCMYVLYVRTVGVCSVMGPPQSTAPTDIFTHTQNCYLQCMQCIALKTQCLQYVGHGSQTVVVP